MAINWTTFRTEKNYPVDAYCVSAEPWVIIIKEANIDHNHKSLTNSMEKVLEHLILGAGTNAVAKTMQVYQWCPGEGLFRVEWYLANKITRDMPPWIVTDVKWTKIANDLKAFEVLYGRGE